MAASTTFKNALSTVLTNIREAGIVPDVIPTSLLFKPSVLFSVNFPGGAGASTVSGAAPGSKLSKEEAAHEPEIAILPGSFEAEEGGAGSSATYTMVMTDPDAPSRKDPKFGQWRHWVITGLTVPTSPSTAFIKTRASSTPYYPPAPPRGTGFHRYVFLLFKEPASFSIAADDVESTGDPNTRRSWNAFKFANRHGLQLVGVNYFMTQTL